MLALLALSVAPVQLPADGWISFDQPAVAGTTRMGCYASGKSSLHHELGDWLPVLDDETAPQTTHDSVRIFVEYAEGIARQVRMFTPDCAISDADIARRVTLDAPAAVKLLVRAFHADDERGIQSHAVTALAHIDHVDADVALESIASDSARREDTHDALFWLAMRRGERGRAFVIASLEPGWPLQHRERAVMALALSEHPEAQDAVRDVARHAEPAELRAQAVMALGITDAPNALADVHSIFLVDESPEVREQAIFALSQLETEEAARILADIIRQPRFGEHRRTALFWLANMPADSSEREIDALVSELF